MSPMPVPSVYRLRECACAKSDQPSSRSSACRSCHHIKGNDGSLRPTPCGLNLGAAAIKSTKSFLGESVPDGVHPVFGRVGSDRAVDARRLGLFQQTASVVVELQLPAAGAAAAPRHDGAGVMLLDTGGFGALLGFFRRGA